MAEIVRQKMDVKESEEPCFVDIHEDEIKLENTEIKGNLDKFSKSDPPC